eukprot:TRINITY_DN15878_c0_g1_i1.p1 TRINITY_DN15878_c0_g1~~TRINITY_DN15878_c0_g1_i1.p1  ORF type:complete len:223 (+),score=35.13 TRINITY_DN15878_c0_g1_i1:439-1107(+)
MNSCAGNAVAAESSESNGQNGMSRQLSEISLYESDDEQDEETPPEPYVPGPLLSLKEQIERDKEDESLRRWKQQLLGCADSSFIEEKTEPEVTFISLGIVTRDNKDMSFSLSPDMAANELCFTLKEASKYNLKFTFTVLHNIVSGLVCMNTVWKAGVQVDQTRYMLGTFAPQQEPYTHVLDEETTPSGAFARGTYSARVKFTDDDGRNHFEFGYTFDIKKNW